MPSQSSSLLTKTQRRRLRNDFADLDEDERRRDQGRIRDRLETGLSDFEQLADYPDRQFELAFEDASERELTRALADARLVTERIREVHGVEREAVVTAAGERADALAGETDTRSLDRLDFRTEGEVREEAEERVRERLSGDRWERRADGLLTVVGATFFPLLFIFLGEIMFGDENVGGVLTLVTLFLFVIGVTALTGALSIKGVRALKYDVAPSLSKLAGDPKGTVRDAWNRL